MIRKIVKEEEVIILDFLPNGYPFDKKPMHLKTPIAQALGKDHFIILELVPKKGIFLQPFEEVYVGEGKRDKIHHINGKIFFDDLTQTAKLELDLLIKEIIEKNEKRFINFFNTCQPINTRRHQMELLPGIGKKHMWEILQEREKKPFESFEDIKNRIKLIPDPKAMVVKRILKEMKGEDKHKIFVEN